MPSLKQTAVIIGVHLVAFVLGMALITSAMSWLGVTALFGVVAFFIAVPCALGAAMLSYRFADRLE